MRRSRSSRIIGTVSSALVVAGPLSLAAAALQTTGPYSQLDRVEGSYVNTLPIPIRPMALAWDESSFYAVNTHGNVVHHFDHPSGIPAQTFATPWSPVSVALWDDPEATSDPERILVVCRGTYCLAILDRATGEILAIIELRDPVSGLFLAEPGDILVDDAVDVAFISCSGSDVVAEVDLVGRVVEHVYKIPGKMPTFLCWDKPDSTDSTAPRNVLVAPLLSGNNSGAPPRAPLNPFAQGPTIIDFRDTTLTENDTKLPDRDLFRLVRTTQSVEPVTKGMGAILFACGVNPDSGKIWQLNTEANNKDKNKQGAAAIRGKIATNRVSIATLPGNGQPPNTWATMIDLDDLLAQQTPSRAIGQPNSLAFMSDGSALITGLLTDNVTQLTSSGAFVREWKLPEGALPRGILYAPSTNTAYVYGWGTNEVYVYRVTSATPLLYTADLGFDPTPSDIRAGRKRFFSGVHSEFGNHSCATCHVDGRSDGLVWDLSDLVLDDKGPMATQTLAGIEPLAPFHWRGEQHDLAAFNEAFVKILGADEELTTEEFAELESFIFSIQKPANPFQNLSRVLDDGIQPRLLEVLEVEDVRPSATAGQDLFQSGEIGCAGCHTLPMGTNNDTFRLPGSGDLHPRRGSMKVTPFNETYRKEQDADPSTTVTDLISIDLTDYGVFDYSLLGVGLSHAGLLASLHQFVQIAESSSSTTSIETSRHLTAFILQWDQGLAPAVHRAILLNEETEPVAGDELENYFIPQAALRNCDLAIFGTSTFGSNVVPMRWAYDRDSQKFKPEDSTYSEEDASFFITQAADGKGSNTIVGLPVGMGEVFAIDYDGDGLYNADEIADSTDPYDYDIDLTDTTSPQIKRAERVWLKAGKTMRINVETDEPTTVLVNYGVTMTNPAWTESRVKASTRLSKTHSIILNDLRLSTPGTPGRTFTYTATVEVEDGAGNTTVHGEDLEIETSNFNRSTQTLVVVDLTWTSFNQNTSQGTLSAVAKVVVSQKIGGPPPVYEEDIRVIARVLVNGVLDGTFTATGSSVKITTIQTGGSDFEDLEGPFLVSDETDNQGEAELGFALTGLTTGDEVMLSIEMLSTNATESGSGILTMGSTTRWSMPDTRKEHRLLKHDY